MSINVTVHGNPVSIRRRKILLADPDDLKKNEFERRRKLRLQQVRQQSKDMANRLRDQVRNERDRQQTLFEREQSSEMKKRQARKLLNLQQKYQECLEDVGMGHNLAAREPDHAAIQARAHDRNMADAYRRGREAGVLAREVQERARGEQAARAERQRVGRTVEDLRSAMVADIGRRRPKRTRNDGDEPLCEIDGNVSPVEKNVAKTVRPWKQRTPKKKAGARKPKKVPPLFGTDDGIETEPSRPERNANGVREIPLLIGIGHDDTLVSEAEAVPRSRDTSVTEVPVLPPDTPKSPREEEEVSLPQVKVTRHASAPSRARSDLEEESCVSSSSEGLPRPCPPPSLCSRPSSLTVEPGTRRSVQPETYRVEPRSSQHRTEPVAPCVQPGSHHVEPTVPSVQPGFNRTQPTASSVQSTSYHIQHTVTGVQPSSYRMQPATPTVQPGSYRTKPTVPPVQPGSYRTQPVAPSIQPGSYRTQPTVPSVQPGSYRTQPVAPSIQPGSYRTQPTVPSVQPGSYRTQPVAPSIQPGSYRTQPTVPSVQPGSYRTQPVAPSIQPGSYRTQPTVPSVQPGSYRTQHAVPAVQPYTFLEPTQPVASRAQPAVSQAANTSTTFPHTVSSSVTTETTSDSADSDCYCSEVPWGGREPAPPNTPATAPMVQYYDHSTRFHSERRADPGLVVRLSAREADDVARAARREAEREEAPARRLQSDTARVAQRARRGNQALERERVHRDYRELLDQLGHLSREERMVRSTQLPGPPLDLHQPDERRKARLAVRQRNMDSAFERVFHSTSHPDDTATITVTSQHTESRRSSVSKTRSPRQEPPRLNVAQLRPHVSPPPPEPEPPTPADLPSPCSSQGSIVVGRLAEGAWPAERAPPPTATLESLMERVNVQRNLLLREVGRDLRVLDARRAPVAHAAEALKRAAERELSDGGGSSGSRSSCDARGDLVSGEATTTVRTVRRNVVWMQTTDEDSRSRSHVDVTAATRPERSRLPAQSKTSPPDEGTQVRQTQTHSVNVEDVDSREKKDDKGSQREEEQEDVSAKAHKERKTPKKTRRTRDVEDVDSKEKDDKGSQREEEEEGSAKANKEKKKPRSHKKKRHRAKEAMPTDFDRPDFNVDSGKNATESSFTTVVSEYSMDMTLSKTDGVGVFADSSLGSSSSSTYEGVKIVVSVVERGTHRTVRSGGFSTDPPPTTTTATNSESCLKSPGNERKVTGRPCRDAFSVDSERVERKKTSQSRSPPDERTESVHKKGFRGSYKDGGERKATGTDKVVTHKDGGVWKTTGPDKVVTHKDGGVWKTTGPDKVVTHKDGGVWKTTGPDKVVTHKDGGVWKTTGPDKVVTHKDGGERRTTEPDKLLTHKDGGVWKTSRPDKVPSNKDSGERRTTGPDTVVPQKDGGERKTIGLEKVSHKDGGERSKGPRRDISREGRPSANRQQGPAWRDRLKQRANISWSTTDPSTSTSYNSPPEEVSVVNCGLVNDLLSKIDRQQARLDAWRSNLRGPPSDPVDPALARYVRRLLGTSREGLDDLGVEVSGVVTPSSSVVGEPSNRDPDISLRRIADEIAHLEESTGLDEDELDFLGWRVGPEREPMYAFSVDSSPDARRAVVTHAACENFADNRSIVEETTLDTSESSVMYTRNRKFRAPSPIAHEGPEVPPSDREEESPEMLYRGLTDECSQRINNLSLLIDQVRVEKRQILNSRCVREDEGLDSTRYESPPLMVSAPLDEVAPPPMAPPPRGVDLLSPPYGSGSEGTTSTSLVARTVFLAEPGDGGVPAQTRPPPALWRNILRNDVPPTSAHELSAIFEAADQPSLPLDRADNVGEEEEEGTMPDVMAEMIRRRLITSPLAHLDLDDGLASDTSHDSRSFYPSILEHVPPHGAPADRRVEPPCDRSTAATDSRPDDSDNDDSTELDGVFDRLGLGWAGATLRKTREAEHRDPGSSSSDVGRNPRGRASGASGRHSTPVGRRDETTEESSGGGSRYFSSDPSTVRPASSDERERLSSSNTCNCTPPRVDKNDARHTPT